MENKNNHTLSLIFMIIPAILVLLVTLAPPIICHINHKNFVSSGQCYKITLYDNSGNEVNKVYCHDYNLDNENILTITRNGNDMLVWKHNYRIDLVTSPTVEENSFDYRE